MGLVPYSQRGSRKQLRAKGIKDQKPEMKIRDIETKKGEITQTEHYQ